jgi:catechol 2,3-dioxygenase-like lactoylglutathione lyase family enzyme
MAREAGCATIGRMKRTPIVMLDHVSLPVRRFAAARKFYEAALGAIGMKVNMEFGDAVGMGSRTQKIFWLVKHAKAVGGAHFAFAVKHREEVHAFHLAALAAGGTDHGAPGPRPDYGPTYYAAFVLDPEGNNIEVVCYARPAHRAPVRRRRAIATKARPKSHVPA